MPLLPLTGHRAARDQLARAHRAGELPQSILLHGPAGIGKERLGLWIAQLLLCEAPDEAGEPCAGCRSCRMALRLEHPDLHWFFPLPRPEGASAERLREKLEDARWAELKARREDPLHLPSYERAPAHFLAAVQTMQHHAAQRPSIGSRKVFVIGDAEAMVPQESSPEAANAFLKLLEEPPPGATIVLTASQPGALLPTIRSRVLPVRLHPLREEEVAAFLEEARGLAPEEAHRWAAAAQGAIGRALRLLPSGDAPGPLEAQRQAARQLLAAALADSEAPRLAAAHAQPSSGARGELTGTLDALAEWVRDLAAASLGSEELLHGDAEEWLRSTVRARAIHPLGVAGALAEVTRARELAYGNVNPQLIVAGLLRGLRVELSRGVPA